MRKEGELVLIHYQDKPTLYARVEAIELDVKKDWYQLTLLLLTIPAQVVTWILREEYIDGETFTMGGHAMRLADVQRVSDKGEGEEGPSSGEEIKDKPAKIIPLKSQSRRSD
jgi:hypothetical protein